MSNNETDTNVARFKKDMDDLVKEFHSNRDPDKLGEYINNLRELAIRMKGKRTSPLAKEVEFWLLQSSGSFHIRDVVAELSIKSEKDRKNLNTILQRLAKEKIIRANDQRGSYRIVNGTTRTIDHIHADDNPIPIILPFAMEEHLDWFPKGIMVLAGDTNAGKTAMMMNLALRNKNNFPKVNYIATEMGSSLLKRRLKKLASSLDLTYPDCFSHINFLEPTSTAYMDMVISDGLTIIDYYEMSDNFYRIADYLRQIYDNLKTGCCFVAMQKKIGKEVGRGGDFAMEKPLLYMTMNRDGTARIMKAKMDMNNGFNPYKTQFRYKIYEGGRIEFTTERLRY
jgi:hypothetical protein